MTHACRQQDLLSQGEQSISRRAGSGSKYTFLIRESSHVCMCILLITAPDFQPEQ